MISFQCVDLLFERLVILHLQLPTGGSKREKPGDGSPEMNDFEENCNNVNDGEECLMRHKLAAHVDYVYTQQHNP